MIATVQPVILTADLDRLLAFYTTVFDATEISRFPPAGPPLYVGLKLGAGAFGFVADSAVEQGISQRILLSVDVDSVDTLLGDVEVAGGRVLGPPNDMPWGQRVAHIHDPDGNTVNLTQTLPTDADPSTV